MIFDVRKWGIDGKAVRFGVGCVVRVLVWKERKGNKIKKGRRQNAKARTFPIWARLACVTVYILQPINKSLYTETSLLHAECIHEG